MKSISVDVACSGNPGPMEYRGVDTDSGEVLFHYKTPYGTNNIGEFLAIVHALAFLKKENKTTTIYTDSQCALTWIKKKKCNTTLKETSETVELKKIIIRAEKWLNENSYENEILKWDTKKLGEIKADFGRKK